VLAAGEVVLIGGVGGCRACDDGCAPDGEGERQFACAAQSTRADFCGRPP
jgi:hypothetical protein